MKHEVAIRGGAVVRQGHLASIKHAVGAHAITDVILNFSTTASHLSRISQALQLVSEHKQSPLLVKDRTGVVLDIFRKHASTAEARLQVRLAGEHFHLSGFVSMCLSACGPALWSDDLFESPPCAARGQINSSLSGR